MFQSAAACVTPNCPDGGGNCVSSNNSSLSAKVEAHASFSGVGGSAQMAMGLNSQNSSGCPPTLRTTQETTNINKNLMSVDNSTLIMNKSSLTSISESINQMVVNSITKTSSSASQNVALSQTMNIFIKGARSAKVTGNKQVITLDLSNSCNMSLSSFDNIRTDLATSVLNQFASATNTDATSSAEAAIQNSIATANAAATKATDTKKIDQQQEAEIPIAAPAALFPPNTGANINSTQKTLNSVENSTIISQPYTQVNDINRTIQSSVLNSVTQNFTRETVTQLMQAVTASQTMNIRIEDISGDVDVSDNSQLINMSIRQTLSQTMNIGTAIANSVKSTLGTSTDDSLIIKKRASAIAKQTTDMRTSNSSSITSDTSWDYSQSFKQLPVPYDSLGALAGVVLCCIVCCSSCIMSAFIGQSMPAGDSGVSSEEASSSEASPEASAEASTEASTASTASPEATPEASPEASSSDSSKSSD